MQHIDREKAQRLIERVEALAKEENVNIQKIAQYEVTKVIAGPSVYICNECVDLCNEIIRKEVTDKKEKNA